MNKKLSHIAWTGVVYFTFMMSAKAASLYDFTSAPIQFGDNNVTVGFKFTANQNLAINALGFYDHNLDGLSASHEVGLFDTNGTLLTSATVQAGGASALDGKFRYGGISSYNLVSGQSYILAGLADAQDGYTYGDMGSSIQGLAIDPAFTINPLASVYLYGPGLSFPINHAGYDLYPMVNLKYGEPSPVPLPAAFPLFGIGLAGIGAMQRRLSKNRAVG